MNNIAPGMILTPMNQKALDDPDFRDQQAQKIPMKRAGKTEEIAKLALLLASPIRIMFPARPTSWTAPLCSCFGREPSPRQFLTAV